MRPLRQAHPRRWSEGSAPDVRCPRDGSRRDPPARRPEEGGEDGEGPGQEAGGGQGGGDRQDGGGGQGGSDGAGHPGGGQEGGGGAAKKGTAKKAAAKKATAKKAAPAARPAGRPPPRRARGRRQNTCTTWWWSVQGPAGASCGFWLADAGWDVVIVEKKEFPREKTCGDGLTPRAVRQLADMGLEGALAGSHRYTGLRAYGFGHSIEMQWPEHPNFPDYGYTITRHDLDGLVAAHAAEAGATLLQGTEVVAPIVDDDATATAPLPTLVGVSVKDKGTGACRCRQSPLPGGGRRVELPLRADARYHAAARAAHGHGPARVLPLGAPRRPLHRVAPRHPRSGGQRGPRLRLDLPHG